MEREDFCWTKFSHEHVTTISRIEAIRKKWGSNRVSLELLKLKKDMMICIMII